MASSAPKPRAAEATQHAIRYVGPTGHTSPVFGELYPNSTYHTADADFVEYLVTKHPDFWQRPSLAASEPKE